MNATIRMSSDDTDDTVKQRSGWLIPIAVFVVTALLSAIFLLYYLAPTPASFIEEHASPTASSDTVLLSLNGMKLAIPANYIPYASARRGGERKDVELFTVYPEFHGYSDWNSSSFSGNAADSAVIFMLLRQEPFKISEQDRLKRIYLTYVADPTGKPGPFGLTTYVFRDDSGYRGEDLFVGPGAKGPIVMRCVRFSPQVPSPSCLRDVKLPHGVALSYRFKRAQLGHWQEIAAGVDKLIQSFVTAAK